MFPETNLTDDIRASTAESFVASTLASASFPIVMLTLALIALSGLALFWSTRRVRNPWLIQQQPLLTILLDGDTVRSADGPISTSAEFGSPKTLADIAAIFDPTQEHISDAISKLVLSGVPFDTVGNRADGSLVHISGAPDGIFARITIFAPSQVSKALHDIQSQLTELMQEHEQYCERLSAVPVAIMELDKDGQFVWSNAEFKALQKRACDPSLFIRALDSRSDAPIGIAMQGAVRTRWFCAKRQRNGDNVVISISQADDLVRAEKSLSRFMATFTDIFAALPVGLAIFDLESRLTLFNPALSNLLGLNATTLAARPSLREFLEALRQSRMVPETRDFGKWRKQIENLNAAGENSTYEDDWTLPSGQIIRVCGKPHADGALVFMFEDISSLVMLERRYRSEIEMGQVTLDNLPDGVAVFDASGAMVFANSAFEDMWKIDSMTTLEAPEIGMLISAFQELADADHVWGKLRRFILAPGELATWEAEIPLRDKSFLQGRFLLMPDGSTMALFRDNGNAAARETSMKHDVSIALKEHDIIS